MVLLPLSLALLRVLLEAAALVRPVALLDSTEADLGCADAECVLPLAGLFSFEDIASSESSCSSSAHVEKTHTHTHPSSKTMHCCSGKADQTEVRKPQQTHTYTPQARLCIAVLKRYTTQKCINLNTRTHTRNTHTHNTLQVKLPIWIVAMAA